MTTPRPSRRPSPLLLLLRGLALIAGAVLLYALSAAFLGGELELSAGPSGDRQPVVLSDPWGLLLAAISFYPPPLWLFLAGLRPSLFQRRPVALAAMISLGTTFISYLALKLLFL